VKNILASVAAAGLGLLPALPASAYGTFFGQDLNGSATIPLASTPNSSAAEALFKANLIGVGTEDFEAQPLLAGPTLSLNFPGAGTATLNSSNGAVCDRATCGESFGRFSVPGGSKYWEVDAGPGSTFSIDFNQNIAAFGFYGIDISDFGGTLSIQLLDAALNSLGTFAVPARPNNDGNVLYFGILATSDAELFRHVVFTSTAGSADTFAFDSMTIGSRDQVVGFGTSIPEPTSLALVGAAFAAAGLARRRRA
jgi:hypothetical protein